MSPTPDTSSDDSASTFKRCTEPECTAPAKARSLCFTHYKARYRANTLPMVALRRATGEKNPQLYLMLTHAMFVEIRNESRRREMKRVQPMIRKLLAFALKRLPEVR